MKIRRLLIAPVIALLTLGFVVDAHAAAIAPTDVTVTNASVADTAINAAAVSVKWSATAGSIAYQVVTSKDESILKSETVNFVSGLTSYEYVVEGLTGGLTYSFVVRAIDIDANSSDSPSSTFQAQSIPTAPTVVSSAAAPGQATLTWSPPTLTSTGGLSLTSYTISSPSLSSSVTATSDATQKVVTGLTAGASYIFKITANNSLGSSAESVFASVAIPSAPSAPAAPTADVSGTSITVNWLEPTSNGGSTVDGYKVYLIDNATTLDLPDKTATLGASDRTTTITGLSAGTYVVKVVAKNAVGDSDRSVASSPLTIAAAVALPIIAITPGSETVAAGSPLIGYAVSSTGGPVNRYSISPLAPAGLIFDIANGTLSGSPTEVKAETVYTITAFNSANDEATATFTLTVTEAGPCYVQVGTVLNNGLACSGVVVIGNDITEIAANSFYQNTGITSLTIGSSVTMIGGSAFAGMSSLTSLTIGSSVETISNYAFQPAFGVPSALESLIIPNSVKTIGIEAFAGMSSLESLTIGNSVTTIDNYAFAGMSSLESLTIPNSVITIGNGAFLDMSSLKSLSIGNSVETIVGFAFSGMPVIATINYCGSNSDVTDFFTTNFAGSPLSCDKPRFTLSSSSQSKTVNTPLDTVTIVSTGGSIDNYSILPLAPAGLTFSTVTGTLSGTPTIVKAETVYTITAFNTDGDEATATFTLTVTEVPPCYIQDGTVLTDGSACTGAVVIRNDITEIGDSAFFTATGITSLTIGSSVTTIGVAFSDGNLMPLSSITSLTIPNSVTNIQDMAFMGMSSLKSLTLPNAITSISPYAFYGMSSLQTLEIPNSVVAIGQSAFKGMSSLTSLSIPSSVTTIAGSAFYGMESLATLIIPNSVTTIGGYAFYGMGVLTALSIPNSVTTIASDAFAGMPSLTSLTIPNSVTTIASGAFYGMSSLTSLTIPNSVTTIGQAAFYGMSSLTSLTIPNSVTTIASDAFYGMSSLTSLTIPNSVTTIGYEAFYGMSSLTSLTIPNSVTTIASDAFRGMSSLESLTIPNSVTTIASGAFFGMSSLTSLTIPNSVTTIGQAAFYGMSSLTSLTIPNSVTTIASDAFAGMSSLTSLTIPNSVTTIGYEAFYGMSSLTSLTIPNSVTTIASGAFYGMSSLTSLTIPNSVITIGGYAFDGMGALTSLTIPNSVTNIGGYAFYNMKSLTTLIIPNSVTNIDNNAFFGMEDLTSLQLSTSLTVIKDAVFYGMKSLTSLTIPSSVTEIRDGAFRFMEKLTSLTIPNTVTSIGNTAFEGMSKLKSLSIPNSVTTISALAFASMSEISEIRYCGNQSGVTTYFSTNYPSIPISGCTPPVVIRLTPTITWATPASITTADGLSAKQLNATVVTPNGLDGIFRYTPAIGTKLTAGTHELSVTFTPADSSNFTDVTATVKIEVIAAIVAATASITGLSATYSGTAHAATVTTSPAGLTYSLTYNGSSAAPTNAGSYTVVATITQAGYSGSASATLVIAKATPTITWATPASITTADGLSAKQLNATVVTPNGLDGIFRYTPAIGTKLTAGTHELSVTFTPADSSNFTDVTATVKIEVIAAIVAATASITGLAATYSGTAHAATVTTSPAGLTYSLTYNGSSAAPTNAGSYTVVATITQAGYSGSASATLVIAKATPTITWATPASITTADGLSVKQLNATASVAGVFTYTPAVGTKSPVGKKDLSVSFAPTDSINYTSVAATNSIVVKVAPPVVTATIVLNGATKKLNTAQLKLITTKAAQTGSIVRVFGYVTKTKDSIKDSNQSLARAVTVRNQIRKSWPFATVRSYGEGSTSEPLCAGVNNLCTVIKVYDK